MSQGAESIPPAPGTEPEEAPQTPPAAEPTTTDKSSGPPESIPYGRFKEVNDQLRGYKELEEYGYDADSLRQLAEWDANFTRDPVANWLQVASQLDDFPEEVKAVVEQHMNGGKTPPKEPSKESPPSGDGDEPVEEEIPAWAKPMVEYISKQEEAEREAEEEAEQEAFDDMLTDTLKKWEEKDKADGFVDDEGNSIIPEKQKLSLIIAAAGRGGFDSVDKLLDAARGDALELREALLKPQTRRSDSPKSVPGGGVPPGNELPAPKTLSEASQRAREFLESQG